MPDGPGLAGETPVVRTDVGPVPVAQRTGELDVVGPGLEQEHPEGRVLSQPGGQDAPGCAASDDHDVVLVGHLRSDYAGTMFWLCRNRFAGSYVRLI